MRVWLVDDKRGDGGGSLEALLKQLEGRPGGGLRLLGASSFQPDFAAAMRKLVPDLLDVLVIQERGWPEAAWTPEILELGLGILVVTEPDRVERFRPLAEVYPVSFVSPSLSADSLWLALLGALTGQRRQAHWKMQVARLQQRLNDRIIIERAKGVLVHRLGISEEDAYKRLRLLSRRQRRQIRDIAQSLLDTQFLFQAGTNGFTAHGDGDDTHELDNGIPGLETERPALEAPRPPSGKGRE
jgi:response regulator NasT